METDKPTRSATKTSDHNQKNHTNPDLIASILIFHLMAPVWYSSLHYSTKNCKLFWDSTYACLQIAHSVTHIYLVTSSNEK